MRRINTIAIVGAGSWGTAVAKNIAESKTHLAVRMWAYEKQVVSSINSNHENVEFLPGIKLPHNITATGDIREAVEGADVVILATPSKAAYDISRKMSPFMADDAYVGFLTKGFCKIDGQVCTISQAMERAAPKFQGRIVAISGPSHAEEVCRRFHTCLNAGSQSAEAREIMAELLTSEYVQCRVTEDIRAVEVGGTLKNPAAIAAGMISVLPRCGDNLSGALMSEALKEMARLGREFGISMESMIDISGLGDLVATSLSPHSRNRRFGRDIANQIMKKGTTLGLWDRLVLRVRPASVIERMSGKLNYLAEGAYAIDPLIELAEARDVPIPVYRSLYEVLLNKKDPSLLIETIKNPDRFNEIFFNTKVQVSNKKRGLEGVRGGVFREMIVARTLDKFVAKQDNRILPYEPAAVMEALRAHGAPAGHADDGEEKIVRELTRDNFDESVRRLAGLYIDAMTDKYTPAFRWILMFFLLSRYYLNRFMGKSSRLLTAGHADEIRRAGTSVSVMYVAGHPGLHAPLFVLMAAFRRRLPYPRFFLDAGEINPRDAFFLRRCGGFIVDRARLGNPVYRETLSQYITTMAGHGVPLLYFLGRNGAADADQSGDEFIAAVTECMYRHAAEVAIVPVEISCLQRPPASTGEPASYARLLANVAQVNFSKPLYLSEYSKQPHAIIGLPGIISGIWQKDRKIFPHFILCKVLADGGFLVRHEAAVKQVKKYMASAGRNFDYGPAKMVKKGLRFLTGRGLVETKGDSIAALDRDAVSYYAGLL
jgi:glycerol-3-phosphate dehydrogenase